MPFHRPSTVGKGQSRENGRFIPLATLSKAVEFSDGGCTYSFEPAVEALTAVVTDETQELLSQVPCLREDLIHLRHPIQLHLGFWAKLLWPSQHPPNDLPRGYVFER